ncbi:MAG: addiction module toxin RelE [Bacteroidales bacterium]|nr:addiction module toxin RelE [Bacteroidales bacterium]
MKYEIKTIPPFDKELKALKKKYALIKDDLESLKRELEENPEAGTKIAEDIYKVRMAIKSKGKRKSGGARVVYLNLFAQRTDSNEIVLLSIYDKSEHGNITDKQIRDVLKSV